MRTRRAGSEGRCAGTEGRVRAQAVNRLHVRRVAEKPETRPEWLRSRKRSPEGEALEEAVGLTGRGRAGNDKGAVNGARGPGSARAPRRASGPMKNQAAGPVLLRWATRPDGLQRPGQGKATLIAFLPLQAVQSGCPRFRKNSPGRRPACPTLGAECSRRPSETSGGRGRRGHRRDVVARDTGPGALLTDAGPLH